MSEPHILTDALVILAAAILVVPLFQRLRASPVLGYLTVGMLVGPHGIGLIQHIEGPMSLAQFGVVFLLFAIGMELSVERLRAIRPHVLVLGGLQVFVTSFAFAAIAAASGLDLATAIIIGGGLALSSTAIVLQMLIERGELAARHGRISFAILIIQDLAVVPLLALLPLLEQREGILGALGLAALKAIAALVIIVLFGRLLLRPALRSVAVTRNTELFTAITLLLVLGVGWLTERAGLSMALGAFLAGLLIAETEYRHQVEGTIEPFRGIFMALFFITVGMNVDFGLIARNAWLVAALVIAIPLLKTTVLFVLARLSGLSGSLAGMIAFGLAQGGEFAFVLFGIAASQGLMEQELGLVLLTAVALTMAGTPALFLIGNRVARALEIPSTSSDTPGLVAEEASDLRDHVVIAGFGRVGQTLARLLTACQVPYIAFDLDLVRVTEGRNQHLPVYFGDASRADLLRAAGLASARAMVVTLDHPRAAERAVRAARSTAPEVDVYVRAHDDTHYRSLEEAGATLVVPEIVEGSLQLGTMVLRGVGQPAELVERVVDQFRDQAYAKLAGLLRPSSGADAGHAPDQGQTGGNRLTL